MRETSKADLGHAQPYLFLGLAEYVSLTGERPMAITWKLEVEIPGGVIGDGMGMVVEQIFIPFASQQIFATRIVVW